MGDQLGESLGGRLGFVPSHEMERLAGLAIDDTSRVSLFADAARLNVLYMVARAGSGHLGSSFSSLDAVSWLHLSHLRPDDVFFSSKGHDAPGLYAVLIGLGRLPDQKLHELRRSGGLPGHPDVGTSGITFNTGSLGMGISKAKGLILGDRHLGRRRRVVVMTGDGELQEGQIWESLRHAVTERMQELTVVVDHNKLQSDTFVGAVNDLGDLEGRFRSSGWTVARCDGHDPDALAAAFAVPADGPRVVIADTVKGRGVSFMEHTSMAPHETLYRYHSGAPSASAYEDAFHELRGRIDGHLRHHGLAPLAVEGILAPEPKAPAEQPQRLVSAYARALVRAAETDSRIMALDADLVLDTGLIDFREQFPTRFVECGIAEQDMVSMAGGLAAAGLLPVVHSFSCFLTSRPNEQIYNNATERRPVVYVGSLAGLLPAGPGHSHQAVRDLASLGAIPDLLTVAPATEREVAQATEFVLQSARTSYLRLCSVPIDVPFDVPEEPLVEGVGRVVREGSSAVVLAYGPVMLTEAWRAAETLAEQGIEMCIIDHPFPKAVDHEWLEAVVDGLDLVIAIDDHHVEGGLGATLAVALADMRASQQLLREGLRSLPTCGSPEEALRAHALDHDSLAARWRLAVTDPSAPRL